MLPSSGRGGRSGCGRRRLRRARRKSGHRAERCAASLPPPFHCISVPARIHPATTPPNEYFAGAARADRSLAAGIGFDQVFAPNDSDIAEMLNTSLRKFEADQLRTRSMEFFRFPEDVGLIFPLALSSAEHDDVWRHQSPEELRIVGKP